MSKKIKTEKKEKSMMPGLLSLASIAVSVAVSVLLGKKK